MHASVHGKKLEQELDKAQKEVNGYVDTTFKYFQNLLDEGLVTEWNQVMLETSHTKGYMGCGGIQVPNKK